MSQSFPLQVFMKMLVLFLKEILLFPEYLRNPSQQGGNCTDPNITNCSPSVVTKLQEEEEMNHAPESNSRQDSVRYNMLRESFPSRLHNNS